MAVLERLVVELATDASKYQQGLGEASAATSSWGGKLAGLAGKAALGAVAAAGAAIAGIGAAGVKEFIGFENSMNEVFTLLPGITAESMGKMQADVKAFAQEFGVLPKETVPALYQALSSGIPKDNVFAFLEVAQQAARGGVTSLETAVDGISSTVNAYGADIVSATRASDLMFTAVKLGKTTFEELSQSLFNVNPTAAALGVKLEDVTAALAAMTVQGVPTSVATTQLRQLLVELSKEGTTASDAFKQLAGKDFQAFIAEGHNLQDALNLMSGGLTVTSDNSGKMAEKTGMIQEKLATLSQQLVVAQQRQSEFNDKTKESTRLANQQRIDNITSDMAALNAELAGISVTSSTSTTKMSDLFGSVEAGNAALALTGKGAEAFGNALVEMGSSTGATEKAFEQMNGGIQASLDRLKAGWATTLLDIGEKAAPALTPLLDAAQQMLPALSGIVSGSLNAVMPSIVALAQGAADLGKYFGFVVDSGDSLNDWLSHLPDAIKPFVKAAGDAVVWIQANWPAIAATVMGVFERVKGVVDSILSPALDDAQGSFAWVKDWIDENLPLMRQTVETIVGAISAFWEAHGEKIMTIVRTFMGIVATLFDTYLKNAFDIVKVVMQLITGDFEGAGETFKGIFTRTFEAILGIIGRYIEMIRGLITGIDWGALGRSIVGGIATGVNLAADLLIAAVQGVGEGVLRGIKALLGIRSPSAVMAAQVGGPMAEGIALGYERALAQARFAAPEVEMLSLGGLSVPADFAVSGLELPGLGGLSVPVDFEIPDLVLPPMTQEVALEFASGRQSAFETLGKNVIGGREMTAALRQAGERAARLAEAGQAQLATLRAGIGQQIDWAKGLVGGLRSEDGAQREDSTRRLEWLLGQLQASVDFDFSPGATVPDGLREMGDEGRGARGEERGTSGQTNNFTFNISAKSEAEARSGVLSALRQAGVAFA